MRVDQSPQRLTISGFADVPVMQMGELASAGTATTVHHTGQAEIDAVGEDYGQRRVTVVAWTA